jgi:hypothetical protein
MPDDRMLWKGNFLKLFAPFPTMNSVHSNAADLRLQSRQVFGLPIEKRTTIKTRDEASELLHSNDVCDPPQGLTPITPRPEGESWRLPDDRMLWIGTALKRFAHFSTI